VTHAWVGADWLSLDTETTGTDVDNDRVITASLLRVPAGSPTPSRVWEWIADPGVDIHPEAAERNKWTNERAAELGRPAPQVIAEIVAALGEQWNAATPLVVANAPYDLTLLDAESRRHLGRPLRLSGYVLDPMVIDKELDKYRRGSRRLDALCAHYGVELVDAHEATADALAALLVTRRLVEEFPRDVGLRHLVELHHRQKTWRHNWAVGYQAYARTEARRGGKLTEAQIQEIVVDPSWPIKSRTPVGAG